MNSSTREIEHRLPSSTTVRQWTNLVAPSDRSAERVRRGIPSECLVRIERGRSLINRIRKDETFEGSICGTTARIINARFNAKQPEFYLPDVKKTFTVSIGDENRTRTLTLNAESAPRIRTFGLWEEL